MVRSIYFRFSFTARHCALEIAMIECMVVRRRLTTTQTIDRLKAETVDLVKVDYRTVKGKFNKLGLTFPFFSKVLKVLTKSN